jgi:hypothetical protein
MAGVTMEAIPKVDEEAVDTLFCSISCMKNPVKYIEYSKSVCEKWEWTTEVLASDYYSKESQDIALIIDFITKINKQFDLDFNLTMEDVKLLIQNNGGYLLIKRDKKEDTEVKHKIYLRPIDLKTV